MQSTIMLRLSSQCETSVMRVRLRVVKKNHYKYALARYEYTLVEQTCISRSVNKHHFHLVRICNGLVHIRNGLVHIHNNNNNNLLPSVFTRLHAVIVSLVSLNLMTLITRLHLQSPRAFRD